MRRHFSHELEFISGFACCPDEMKNEEVGMKNWEALGWREGAGIALVFTVRTCWGDEGGEKGFHREASVVICGGK